MNLRKWLSKTKETITTTTLDTVVLLTANNNSNNKKLSEKPKGEKETFRRYYWL